MIDAHHYATLEASGPKSWGRNIASSHMPSVAAQAAELYCSAFSCINPKRSAALSLAAMVKLQAAATLLAHSIATRGGYDSAREIYNECRCAASILGSIAGAAGIKTLDSRDACKYSGAVYQIASSLDIGALTFLLIDIIRIATTIAED